MRVISLFVHYAALHHRVTKIQIENNIYHKVMESQRLPFLLYLSLKFVSLCVYVYERIQQMHKILDDTHPNQKHITLQTIERLLIFCASLMCVFYGVLQNENLSNFKHKQNCIYIMQCMCVFVFWLVQCLGKGKLKIIEGVIAFCQVATILANFPAHKTDTCFSFIYHFV